MNFQKYYKPNKIISLIERKTLNIFLIHLSENKITNPRKDLMFVCQYFNLSDIELSERYEVNFLDVSIAYVQTRKMSNELL